MKSCKKVINDEIPVKDAVNIPTRNRSRDIARALSALATVSSVRSKAPLLHPDKWIFIFSIPTSAVNYAEVNLDPIPTKCVAERSQSTGSPSAPLVVCTWH